MKLTRNKKGGLVLDGCFRTIIHLVEGEKFEPAEYVDLKEVCHFIIIYHGSEEDRQKALEPYKINR